MPRTPAERGLGGLLWLFGFMVMYIVCPIRDVPLLGLSLSAPIFAIIVLALVREGHFPMFIRQSEFRIPIAIFLVGMALSSLTNGVLGRAESISLPGMLHSLAAFTYWVLLFLVMAYSVARWGLERRILVWISIAIAVLAVVVIAEYAMGLAAIRGGRGELTSLSQNEIGIQFSAFGLAPIALAMISRQPSWRLVYLLIAVVTAIAVMVNSSRGSWVALSLGLLVIWLLSKGSRWRRRLVVAMGTAATITVGWWSVAPAQLTEKTEQRAATFERLESDESYQARGVLVQKAWHLFLAHPVVGVGPGMFRFHSVQGLELPFVLRGDWESINRISAHNAYMLQLAEGGLVTMVPLLAFVISLGVKGSRAALGIARRANPVGIVFLAMFVALSAHLWVLSGLGSSGTWLIYALLASVVAMERSHNLQRRRGWEGASRLQHLPRAGLRR